MLRSIFIIASMLCIGSFTACSSDEPELKIPEDKLVKILVDVHVAEAGFQNLSGEVKDSIANVYYEQIAEMHQIDRVLLDSTIIQVRRDAIKLTSIYDKVLEELARQEATVK